MELNTIKNTGTWGESATAINENNQKINSEVEKLKYVTNKCKGLHVTEAALKTEFPNPKDGDWAIIGTTVPGPIWSAGNGVWSATGETGGGGTIDVAGYATTEQLNSVRDIADESLITAEKAKKDIADFKDSFQVMSESEYENLPIKDPNVFYMTYEEE